MQKLLLSLIAFLLAAFALHSPTSAKNDMIYVVTTTAQIADIAHNIKPDHMVVENLMGTGVDPHLYRPTRSDIVKLKNADIVLYNGLHLEGQMIELFEKLKKDKPVIGLADELPEDLLIIDGENQYDPHIWMNVRAWEEATNAISSIFQTYDPAYKNYYAQRADIYARKLALLDEHIKNVIQTIPLNARTLVTAHDAFGYFGQAYGIEVVGIQGLSTESEAGLKHIDRLSQFLSQKNIPAIFAESSVNDRNIKALIEGTKNKGHNVKIGGTLFSDAMGPSGTYEGTYIGMMEHNVRTLTAALGGTPDPFVYDNMLADAYMQE